MKIIKENFLVVSDYNWLPENIETSWITKYTDNYLIYDRYHRFEQNKKIKWQKNVGQNVYDIFDFIITNYDNLPETTIFCRACIFNKKDDGVSRFDTLGKKISTGNCSEEYFLKVCNNNVFTELQDFTTESWRFNGITNKIGEDNSYLELNTNIWNSMASLKYYNNIDVFFSDLYVNPEKLKWIRFSPGANYIIPKKNILKYSKKFYEKIRSIIDWDIITGESHMIERAIYTIFNNNYIVKEEYK